MNLAENVVCYRLELQDTALSTGFFAAVPEPSPTIKTGFSYLRHCSNDSFMHAHLLGCLAKMPLDEVDRMMAGIDSRDHVVRALILEAATIHGHLKAIRKRFTPRARIALSEKTPLIYLRSEKLSDHSIHKKWARYFSANLTRHRPLPPPDATGLDFPVKGVDGSDEAIADHLHLKAVVARRLPRMKGAGTSRRPLSETISDAQERLEKLGIFDGPEMRHQSSLSPIALLRKWRLERRVRIGRLDYTISGVQTSYGRGTSLDQARASCLMEVAERVSAFAGIEDGRVRETLRPHPLIHGSRTKLMDDGHRLVDPNDLGLEVPYGDEPLYWMEGRCLATEGESSVWVPVQCVYLFSNLDERNLFSGLGSTGLASGNTVAEARLSALYELIERDSEAVNPFHPSRCFRVYAKDERINRLFQDYRDRGIHIFFQDISPEYGIPCCLCWVSRRDGTVTKGGGVDLNGKRAVLSALTETPYPYPMGPPSSPAPPDLPWLEFESLPDFSTGTPDRDLALVQETLRVNGFSPVYVDITRKDLAIPVVKALVPGFELMADFDPYSRISSRIFNNYLKIHKLQ